MDCQNQIKVLLISTLFFGCAIGPDYVEPSTFVGNTFVAGVDDDNFVADEINREWWKSFSDETLSSLIENGIKENKDVKIAIYRINESRALRRKAGTSFLPSATVNGEYSKGSISSARFPGGFQGGSREIEYYSSGLDALWELDIFGRVRRSYESAEAEEEGSVARLADVTRIIQAEIATNYIELRGTQERLDVARSNASSQSETVRLIATQFDSGKTSQLDLSRANAQRDTTKSMIPKLEVDERVLIHRLAVLTGKEPGALVGLLSGREKLPQYNGPVKIGDPASLIQRRPDIRAAKADLHALTAQIGVETGLLFTKLTLIGNVSVEAKEFSDLSGNSTNVHSYGPSISWEGLNFNNILSRIDAAEVRTSAGLIAYEKAVLLALEDIENSLMRFSKNRERWRFLDMAAKESRRAADIADEKYRVGEIDFLTVLDAQRVALTAEDAASVGKTEVLTSLVGLYKALGGGWREEDSQT